MPQQRDPVITLGVLGLVGFVGWQWAQTQPATSSARQTVDRIRGTLGPKAGGTAGSAQRTTSGAPAAAPVAGAAPASTPAQNAAAGLTMVQQYNEQHTDGWYQATQWSDGHWDFVYIAPQDYPAYGIPTDGAPVQGPPAPVWGPVARFHDTDSQWWAETGWSDGTTTYQYIDPSEYPIWGILPDGSGYADPSQAFGAPAI